MSSPDEEALLLLKADSIGALRRDYDSLKRIVSSGMEFAGHLRSVEQTLRIILEDGENTERVGEANKNFFLRTMLPGICTAVMNRSTLDDGDMVQINHIFQLAIDVVLKYITPDLTDPLDHSMVETLSRILNPINYNFFHFSTLGHRSPRAPPAAVEGEDDECESFASPQVDVDVSKFLPRNINYFGTRGGFDKILARLQSEPKPDVLLIKALIKPFSKIVDHLRVDLATQIVKQTHAIVTDLLLNMTPEELRRADKKCISDISKIMMVLLKRVYRDEYEEMVDRFNLKIALTCFTCPYLDKRVAGLNDIKDHIQTTLMRKEYESIQMRQEEVLGMQFGYPKRMYPNYRVGWLTTDILLDWLEENKIMERLYGETMHPDLLSRCMEVPRFLATEGKLTDEHLDLIWNCAQGHHETVVHAIQNSLAELVTVLPHSQVVYLYDKISSLPFAEYDAKTFYLLRSVCREAIREPKKQPYGIDIVWRLIQDGTKVSEEVKHMGASFIRDLLKWAGYRGFRRQIMNQCFDNLRSHTSVLKALFILKSIFVTYGVSTTTDADTTASIILWASKEHNLLDVLLNDLETYKAKTMQEAERQGSIGDPAWGAYVFEGQFYTHQSHINDRLEFLQYVLSNSPLSITPEQLHRIWVVIVCNALCISESDAFFQWFINTSDSFNDFQISDEVVRYAFHKLLPTLDMSSFSPRAFQLFRSFFVRINVLAKKVRKGAKDSDPVTVLAFPLEGTELLWKIAHSSPFPDAGMGAITLLIDLYRNISIDLEATIVTQRIEAINVCMNTLMAAVAEEQDSKILRCLTILKRFVEDFDPPQAYKTRHGYIVKEAPIEVTVVPMGKKSIVIHTTANETVGGLREKVATALSEHPKRLRLVFSGVQLTRDNDWLWYHRIYSRSTVHAVLNTAARVEAGGDALPANFAHYPSRVMATGAYFEKLFQLLNLGNGIGAEAWDLLKILPPNEEAKASIRDVRNESPDWNAILDPRSTFKLLYLLQIVDAMQYDGDVCAGGASLRLSDTMLPEARSEWRQWFIESGGLQHLVRVALRCEELLAPAQGNRRHECAALLFKTVNTFLVDVAGERDMPSLREDGQLLERSVGAADAVGHLVGITLAVAQEELTEYVLQRAQSEIVEHALVLLTAVCVWRQEAMAALLDSPLVPQWLETCLLTCSLYFVRQCMAQCIARLCTRHFLCAVYLDPESVKLADTMEIELHPAALSFFAARLLPMLCTFDPRQPQNEQSLVLLNHLLVAAGRSGVSVCEPPQLLEELLAMFAAHPVVEVRHSPVPEDRHLIALLGLIGTVARTHPTLREWAGSASGGNMLARLEKALFEIPSAEHHGPYGPPLCKTRSSRMQAFHLLRVLADGSPGNHADLVERLMRHHELPASYEEAVKKRSYGWMYHPSGIAKSHCGYVGLKNQGATCYVNSLMQQFYMIPAFRRGILAMHDEVEDDVKSAMFLQLQSIFANLQESEKQFYDTIGFCESFKDHDGQPINPKVQMDVDEFFNLFLDRLETALRGTPQEKILDEFFGGRTSNQVISNECEHVSDREETFFTISVGVKGKKTLQESLDLYVEGDMLAGDNKYRCDRCDKHVDALKRCCLSALPKTLIIHLRRLDFDVEVLRRVKVNDFLEFPMHLNMEPYTKEGLARIKAEEEGREVPAPIHPDSYYQYELTGILVHMGTADSGHYYSFIREREPSGEARRWLQFNDQSVEYFDEREIPAQCFGGAEATNRWNPTTGREVSGWQEKNYSAYMLFYDRVGAYDEATLAPGDDALSASCDLIRPEIYQQVWVDNMRFLKDLNVFDSDYFHFLWGVVSLNCPDPAADPAAPAAPPARGDHRFRCIQLAVHFLAETLSRSRESKFLYPEFVESLCAMLAAHKPAAEWVCEEALRQGHWMEDLLLQCSNDEPRAGFANVLVAAMAAIRDEQRPLYVMSGSDGAVPQHSDKLQRAGELIFIDGFSNPAETGSVSVRLMDRAFDMLPMARKQWRQFAQFFLVFSSFAAFGEPERLYLCGRQAVAHIVHFYLQNDSPIRFTGDDVLASLPRIGDKYKVADVHFLVAFLRHMVCGCPRQGVSTQPPTLTEGAEALALHPLDEAVVYCESLFFRLMEDGVNAEHIADMVEHLAWENEMFSMMVIDQIKKGLDRFDKDKYDAFLCVLERLLKIQDSMRPVRMSFCLEGLVRCISDNLMYCQPTAACIRFLRSDIPGVSDWVVENAEMWMKKWLFSGYEMIRDTTEALIYSLVPERPPPDRMEKMESDGTPVPELSAAAAARLRDLNVQLCRLLGVARSCIAKDPRHPRSKVAASSMSHQTREVVSSGPTAVYRLCAFFRLLKWTIRTKEDRDFVMSAEVFPTFWHLFDEMDRWKYEVDAQKLEATRTLWHIIQDHPEYVPQLTAREIAVRLMDHFICLRPSDREIYYNKSAVPAFYNIMAFLAKHNHAFMLDFADHRNFDWALLNVVIAREYQEGAELVFSILEPAAKELPSIRVRGIPRVLHRTTEIQFSWSNCIRILQNLVQDEKDVQVFCQHGGIEVLSQMSDLNGNSVHTKESKRNIQNTLALFQRACEWMRSNAQHVAVETALRGWKSPPQLLNSLYAFMERSSDPGILASTYQVLTDLAALDSDLLDPTLFHLRQNHQKFYDALIMASTLGQEFDADAIPSSMRPGLLVHRDRADVDHGMQYYTFALTMCRIAFAQEPLRERLLVSLDLLLFIASECGDIPLIHTTAVNLLEEVLASDTSLATTLVVNRKFARLIVRMLTTDYLCLCDASCLRFVVRSFHKAAGNFGAADVEKLVALVHSILSSVDRVLQDFVGSGMETDESEVTQMAIAALRSAAIVASDSVAKKVLVAQCMDLIQSITTSASVLAAMLEGPENDGPRESALEAYQIGAKLTAQ